MIRAHEYSFLQYLSAKKSIDDRSLHPRVWDRLISSLPESQRLRVLELGMGIGTMLERLVACGGMSFAEYTGIDAVEENVLEARRRLPSWANSLGYSVEERPAEGHVAIRRGDLAITADFQAVDLAAFLAHESDRRAWDLLLANAFLDLVDVPSTVPSLLSLLAPGGLFHFSINFDGLTSFQPELEPDLDREIERLYHGTMDRRIVDGRRSGESRTGRHLFAHLTRAGASILDIGASDWVVFPRGGTYREEEEYFLRFILSTIHSALRGHPELDAGRLEAWIAARRQQIDRGELFYLAHQLDYLGQVKD
jgi:SAM-dependent methyltransferase